MRKKSAGIRCERRKDETKIQINFELLLLNILLFIYILTVLTDTREERTPVNKGHYSPPWQKKYVTDACQAQIFIMLFNTTTFVFVFM